MLHELRSDYHRISVSKLMFSKARRKILTGNANTTPCSTPPSLASACFLMSFTIRMSGEEDETKILLKERGAAQRSLQMADSYLESCSLVEFRIDRPRRATRCC